MEERGSRDDLQFQLPVFDPTTFPLSFPFPPRAIVSRCLFVWLHFLPRATRLAVTHSRKVTSSRETGPKFFRLILAQLTVTRFHRSPTSDHHARASLAFSATFLFLRFARYRQNSRRNSTKRGSRMVLVVREAIYLPNDAQKNTEFRIEMSWMNLVEFLVGIVTGRIQYTRLRT